MENEKQGTIDWQGWVDAFRGMLPPGTSAAEADELLACVKYTLRKLGNSIL